ncbi:hairy-related 3 [Poecilia latipinna]|uniref:hairy-related 3 n=1 Tax=Poecilia latipinna TaxID=48699 RepID=UPI00072DC7F6|nr:PREDICTED: transcription factor HES-3 [Poecilia latipinna]
MVCIDMLSGCSYKKLPRILRSGQRRGKEINFKQSKSKSGLKKRKEKKRMVATSECGEKGKPGSKVSKPLMEKKRRARINQCLDELKSLLESYYSSSIRKRKLEKADILELTVKHLRNLQKIQSISAGASEFPDYQLGFRNCLANVNQYLLLADHLNGSERWMMSQLSNKLCRSWRRSEASSTTDSDPSQPEAAEAEEEKEKEEEKAGRLRLPSANGHEGERNPTRSVIPTPRTAHTASSLAMEDTNKLSDAKQTRVFAQKAPTGSIETQSSRHRNLECASQRLEAGNAERNVWRPW